MAKITWIPIIIVVALGIWVGWGTYHYVFDTTPPTLTIEGLENDGWYAGDIHGVVIGKDDYKVHEISLWLDGKPLINSGKINRQQFEYPFPIPTKNLSHGMHTLKVIVKDASYAGNEAMHELVFGVDNIPIQASFIKSDADLKVFQGRTLHVQFQVNKPIQEANIKTLSNTFPCFPEVNDSLVYECFIPIHSEEIPNEYLFLIEITDRVGTLATLENKFQVVMYPFKKQHLVLNSAKVKEENNLGLSESQLERDLEEITKKSPKKKLWQGNFYVPLDLRGISTEFGTVRVTQERGKYQHNAIDVLGAPKSVIWAPQDGIVVLKNRYAHSGNTLVIDHGYGILSLFFHLDSFGNNAIGDKIKKGNPLGTLGMTGYASGYHLHWEMRIMMIPIDPMQWTKHDF